VGGWRNFTKYCLGAKSRRMKLAGHVEFIGDIKMHTIFWLENLTVGFHLEDVGIDGRIILEWMFEKEWRGVDWMHLAQDRDQWWALVNTLISLWVPQKAGNFLTI